MVVGVTAALDQVGRARGPLGTVWHCPHCDFRQMTRPAMPGSGAGRGHGLRQASLARSAVARHIKSEHPETITQEPKP